MKWLATVHATMTHPGEGRRWHATEMESGAVEDHDQDVGVMNGSRLHADVGLVTPFLLVFASVC